MKKGLKKKKSIILKSIGLLMYNLRGVSCELQPYHVNMLLNVSLQWLMSLACAAVVSYSSAPLTGDHMTSRVSVETSFTVTSCGQQGTGSGMTQGEEEAQIGKMIKICKLTFSKNTSILQSTTVFKFISEHFWHNAACI